MDRTNNRITVIYPALLICAGAGVALGVMEWLFFMTKPSFLGVFSGGQRFLSLLGVASVLAFLLLAVQLLFVAVAGLPVSQRARLKLLVLSIVPAVALTGLSLLLADNFTNALLGFGSESSSGLIRLIYLFLVLACLAVYTAICGRWIMALSFIGPWHFLATLVVLVVVLATGLAGVRGYSDQPLESLLRGGDTLAYNVLIIGSDGVNAHNLSVYGYERETSAFLEKLAGESLLARNAFTNSAHSSAAIVALLTGKYPFESGLIYTPDVLQGQHSYQSLPALLRAQLGYRTFQASFPTYADALDMNLKNAFDVVNGRSGIEDAASRLSASLLGESTSLLVMKIRERLASRLLHVLHIRAAHDVYDEVAGAASKAPVITDDQRLRDLLKFIDAADGPFFAHVHLMGTHGPFFRPKVRKYSEGQEQDAAFMPDFYDDAIADFDRHLAGIYRELRDRGLLENTILVVYSDHGIRFATDEQLPLLVRAPGLAPGTVQRNVEIIDIPRTLVDILGINAPEWMGGRSLLDQPLAMCRPVLSAGGIFNNEDGPAVAFAGLPSLGVLKLILGNSSYQWRLVPDEVYISAVSYRTPQPDCPVMSRQEVRAYLSKRLTEAGHGVK